MPECCDDGNSSSSSSSSSSEVMTSAIQIAKSIGYDAKELEAVPESSILGVGCVGNVEFKKGDIERGIPIEENASDVVISNCVINLTLDKVAAFKEIYRILRSNGTAHECRFIYLLTRVR